MTEARAVSALGKPPADLAFYVPHLVLVLCFLFSALMFSISLVSEEGERSLNIALYNVAAQDFAWLGLAVIAYPVCWVYSLRANRVFTIEFGDRGAWLIALAILVFVWVGTFLVYHDFALSMDEFMMRWQSKLLLEGYLLAPGPDAWWPYSHATRPGFLIVDEAYRFWAPGYRPGTALIHALFAKVGLGSLMNALFCAGCILLLWKLARRDLPQAPDAAVWAVILLATGPQFLITGMTPYTMTAHLFASLLWVWLFTQDRPAGHVAAIVLGCYALGLHHVHVHSFFAFPFLVHLLFVQKRWLLSLAYAASYAVAGLVWIFWMDVAIWVQGLVPGPQAAPQIVDGDLGFVKMAFSHGMANHGWSDLIQWGANITRLIAWQNLALLPLFLIALRHFREMPLTLRLLAWSVLTSLVPYVVLMPSQGHGWGYRYLHQVLGNLALIAGFGWMVVRDKRWRHHMRFAAVLAIVSCVVAIPLRAVQVEALVRPFANTMAALRSQSSDIVVINADEIWYGRDLVRNDPLIENRPVILALHNLDEARLRRLCDRQSVRYEDAESLRKFGMLRAGNRRVASEQQMADLRVVFERAGCKE